MDGLHRPSPVVPLGGTTGVFIEGRCSERPDLLPRPGAGEKGISEHRNRSNPGDRLSSPTRDGANEIQIDDTAGSERMRIKAERDQNIVIANDRFEHVMSNEVRRIQRDESISIGANQSISAQASAVHGVGASQSVSLEPLGHS